MDLSLGCSSLHITNTSYKRMLWGILLPTVWNLLDKDFGCALNVHATTLQEWEIHKKLKRKLWMMHSHKQLAPKTLDDGAYFSLFL